jgi:putative SOS response-associated peptidase YedK
MVNRYSLAATAQQLAERYAIETSPAYQPNYNASPSQLLPIITNTGSQGLSFFYWGLAPQWAKNKTISEKLINARTELFADKPVMKKNLMQRRCIVPADGFYGWKKVGKKAMIPYRLVLKSRELFSMAGLWEEYDDEQGESFHTFSIITVPSNEIAASISERMPVMIDKSVEKKWLRAETPEADLLGLLVSLPSAKMDAYTISPRVNSISVNDAALLLPAPAADQFGNLSLFD